jgi:hypothetical protein
LIILINNIHFTKIVVAIVVVVVVVFLDAHSQVHKVKWGSHTSLQTMAKRRVDLLLSSSPEEEGIKKEGVRVKRNKAGGDCSSSLKQTEGTNNDAALGTLDSPLYDVPLVDNDRSSTIDCGSASSLQGTRGGQNDGGGGDDDDDDGQRQGKHTSKEVEEHSWSPDSTDVIREVRKNLMGNFVASPSSPDEEGDEDDEEETKGIGTSSGCHTDDSYTTFLQSMTTEQTEAMMEGFESYIKEKKNQDNVSFCVAQVSSIDRLLFCGEQDCTSRASRFEPDFDTLKKVRKTLFE